jgi:hypothetical protein
MLLRDEAECQQDLTRWRVTSDIVPRSRDATTGAAWIGACRIWLLVFATLIASGAQAAKLTSAEQTQIEEPRPADVPSDAMMEAAGALIGAIELQVGQIFDERDPRENSGLYHLANQLHVRTKRATIRAHRPRSVLSRSWSGLPASLQSCKIRAIVSGVRPKRNTQWSGGGSFDAAFSR